MNFENKFFVFLNKHLVLKISEQRFKDCQRNKLKTYHRIIQANFY